MSLYALSLHRHTFQGRYVGLQVTLIFYGILESPEAIREQTLLELIALLMWIQEDKFLGGVYLCI
jgi:hypothetical protein